MRSRVGVALVVCLAACSSSTTPDVRKLSVRVSPSSGRIYVGQLETLHAASVDDAGDSTGLATVTWSSSAPGVASVTDYGLVVGLTPGATTVVAVTGAGIRDSATITVVHQPCGGFAEARHLRGTAAFRYAYAAMLGEIQYVVNDSATMNFIANGGGFGDTNMVVYVASATGNGSERETRTDHSNNAVQTLTSSGSLLASDLDFSSVTIYANLSTCTYTMEGIAYIDVFESPTPGDLGAKAIGWFRTTAEPLDSASHSESLTTHSPNWMGGGSASVGLYVPVGFSTDYFGEGAPDDGTTGTASITVSVAQGS